MKKSQLILNFFEDTWCESEVIEEYDDRSIKCTHSHSTMNLPALETIVECMSEGQFKGKYVVSKIEANDKLQSYKETRYFLILHPI